MKKLYSPTFADWPCPFEVRYQVGLAARWPLDGARYADTNRYKNPGSYRSAEPQFNLEATNRLTNTQSK